MSAALGQSQAYGIYRNTCLTHRPARRLALHPGVSADPSAGSGEAAATAVAAAAAAGELLPQRLATLLGGLLPGTWAAWLRGEQVQ
jgi:hypothetical protein